MQCHPSAGTSPVPNVTSAPAPESEATYWTEEALRVALTSRLLELEASRSTVASDASAIFLASAQNVTTPIEFELKHCAAGSSTTEVVESNDMAIPSSNTLSPAPPFCDAITICGTCVGSG